MGNLIKLVRPVCQGECWCKNLIWLNAYEFPGSEFVLLDSEDHRVSSARQLPLSRWWHCMDRCPGPINIQWCTYFEKVSGKPCILCGYGECCTVWLVRKISTTTFASELFQCPFSNPSVLDISVYKCRVWTISWYGGASEDKYDGNPKPLCYNGTCMINVMLVSCSCLDHYVLGCSDCWCYHMQVVMHDTLYWSKVACSKHIEDHDSIPVKGNWSFALGVLNGRYVLDHGFIRKKQNYYASRGPKWWIVEENAPN